jgi:hypothetical protein
MPAYARSHIVPPDEAGVYHCMARCVRRAFLCGVDLLTNHDYDYRREWIRERLELLASVVPSPRSASKIVERRFLIPLV